MKANTVRIGFAGYARFLAKLRDTPCTLKEAPAVAGVGHNCAWRFISGMYALGLIHISDWRMEPNAPTTPVFTAGPGCDAPRPTHRPNGKRLGGVRAPSLKKPASELLAFKSLLTALEHPASRRDLAAETGINQITVREALNALVSQKLARIALWEWREHGGPPIPQYVIGPGINAKRPTPMSKATAGKLYRQRKEEAAKFAPLAQVFQPRRIPELAEAA